MGYVYAIVAAVLWGLVQIPIKLAKAPGRVGVMISMPAGIAAIVVILLFQGSLALPEASRGDWVLIFVAGLAIFPLATFTYFEAVHRAGITTAAPITRLTPILVVLVSAAFPEGRLLWSSVFAAVMIFIGGVLLTRGAHQAHPIETHKDLRVGLAYAFVACLLWAVGLLCVDRVSSEVPRSLVLVYGLSFGAVVYWVAMGVIGRLKELRRVTRRDLLCYGTQGVVSFALGYWAAFESMDLLGIGRVAVIIGAWPVVGSAVGLVVFRERVNSLKLAGMVLLILSAVLAGIGPWLEEFLLTLW